MTNVVICGEAWGADEARERTAYVGYSGWLLTQMLEEAGIRRADCFLTNVFNFQPEGNNIETLCGGKADGISGYPALTKSKYVRAEFEPELERLRDELLEHNPNVIIATGNVPLWALTGNVAISKRRGTTLYSTKVVSGFKVLPVYHPAAIGRQWDLRAVTVLDLQKAERESHFPEIIRPRREVWIEPELEDLERFYELYIRDCDQLCADIETVGTQISCIGFAPSPTVALVVPFIDHRRARGSYWPNKQAELAAWRFVIRMLDLPCGKTFQNGVYDIAFLWRSYRIQVRNPSHDTMLLSHALQPEAPKGLAFLGSVFTNESSWKLSGPRYNKTLKKED